MSPHCRILYAPCRDRARADVHPSPTVEALGFLTRIFITQPSLRSSIGVYILMDSLIVLAPAAFLAFNYITYGRTVRLCTGREHSFIRPEIVGRTFVISDIVTFLIQVPHPRARQWQDAY